MKPTFITVLKKVLLFSICFSCYSAFAQNVGINETGDKADKSAMLDILAEHKGILIPRIRLLDPNDKQTIIEPAHSLLVYNTNGGMPDGIGYYYNTGTAIAPLWVKLSVTASNPSWLISGNSDVNDDVSYMGTNINEDVVFRRNGVLALQMRTGGAMLFTGDATGVTPESGQGKRMMWIPKYSAFRAGKLDDLGPDFWNDVNIGDASFAANFNTRATGLASAAFGYGTQATNSTSIAFGNETVASGNIATSMGDKTTASGTAALATGTQTTAGGSNSFASGYLTEAIAINSFATGDQTNAFSANSFAIGSRTLVTATNAMAMGDQAAAAGVNSLAAGFRTDATEPNAVAMGDRTEASGTAAFAMGQQTVASGPNSFAIGDHTEASGGRSFAIGGYSKATGTSSFAGGGSSEANGTAAVAFGDHTIANVSNQLAIGRYNVISNVQPNDDNISFRAFQVGNGTNTDNRNDAAYIRYNGNMFIAGNLTEGSDIRWKKDIAPLKSVLKKVITINPITYHFKNTNTNSPDLQIGFSAQEIQQQFPELVSVDERGYLSIGYTRMSAVLLQAIKEQQQQIETLKKEKQDQKEINDQLLQRIEKIEAAIKK